MVPSTPNSEVHSHFNLPLKPTPASQLHLTSPISLSLSLSSTPVTRTLKMTTLSNSVKLKYIKLGYQCPVNHILAFFLIPILMGFLIKILSLGPDQIYEIWSSLHFALLQFSAPPWWSYSLPPSSSCPSLVLST